MSTNALASGARDDRLYALLPAIHRIRDAENGYPLKALLRFLTFTCVVVSVVGFVHFRQQRLQRLERERHELLATLEQAGQSLSHSDLELPRRVAAAIALESSPVYAGDLLPDPPATDADLTEMLAPPTLYVRGPLDALARPDRRVSIEHE